jgi:hypothetical protein
MSGLSAESFAPKNLAGIQWLEPAEIFSGYFIYTICDLSTAQENINKSTTLFFQWRDGKLTKVNRLDEGSKICLYALVNFSNEWSTGLQGYEEARQRFENALSLLPRPT